MSLTTRVFVVLFVMLILGLAAWGQISTGTIIGSVEDSTGAVVPNAAITIVHQAGWRAARIERLADVEWAYRVASKPVLGWLESIPRFVVLADG